MAEKEIKKTKPRKLRNIITAAVVFAIAGALFVNWYIGTGKTVKTSKETGKENLGQAQYVNATTAANNYFDESKLKRQKIRDQTMKELSSVIDDASSTNEQKKKAVETYSKLSERAALENDIETLICAKGITKCIVILGDRTCEVVVPKGELNDDVGLQIKEIINNKAKTDPLNISISALK